MYTVYYYRISSSLCYLTQSLFDFWSQSRQICTCVNHYKCITTWSNLPVSVSVFINPSCVAVQTSLVSGYLPDYRLKSLALFSPMQIFCVACFFCFVVSWQTVTDVSPNRLPWTAVQINTLSVVQTVVHLQFPQMSDFQEKGGDKVFSVPFIPVVSTSWFSTS